MHLKIIPTQSALVDDTSLTFSFAHDIDGLAGSEDKLADLVSYLDKTSAWYGMEINAQKKLMTDSADAVKTKITRARDCDTV